MTVASLQGSLGKLSAFLDECSRDLTLRRRKEDLRRKRQLALRQVALLIQSAMKRVQGLEPKDFFDTAGCPGLPLGLRVFMCPAQDGPRILRSLAQARGERLAVRLLRVGIGGKEAEILAASPMDAAEFPRSVLKAPYFKRWGVEAFFGRLKDKFQAEVSPGKSPESVRQGPVTAVFLANLRSMVIGAAKPEVHKAAKRGRQGCRVNRDRNLGLPKPLVQVLPAHNQLTLESMTKRRHLRRENLKR